MDLKQSLIKDLERKLARYESSFEIEEKKKDLTIEHLKSKKNALGKQIRNLLDLNLFNLNTIFLRNENK